MCYTDRMRFTRLFLQRFFHRELVEFFKNLALMAESGIPLNESLHVLEEQARSSVFRNFLHDVRRQVEEGSPLSKAMLLYREDIGDLALNVIRAGEVNGTLEQNFRYLADILQRRRELKEKINGALLYPEIVLGLVFLLGGAISIFILPKLIPLFQSLNVALPLSTRMLLGISVFLQENAALVFVGMISVIVLLIGLARFHPVRYALHTVQLHLPYFGRLSQNYQLALFAQIFGTLFRSGLTIRETLTVTTDALTNFRYRAVLRQAAKRLVAGIPLGAILSKFPNFFPQNLIALISVGEQSGKLDESFKYLATYYDHEVDVQTKRLPTMLEPILLVIIGVVVLFVSLAILTPIYEITSGINAGR